MNNLRQDFFGDILSDLQKTGLDFIVCGGVAAIIHGVERTTLDLDISVSLHPENVPLLVSAMEKLGLQPRVPVDPHLLSNEEEVEKMIHEKHAVVFTFIHPKDTFLHVDVFILPELRYEALLPFSEEKEFRSGALTVLTAQKLLDLKKNIQPSRKKDELDILELERIIHES